MILLLFSVFALLHITTSDRNLIDGSYGSCNYSSPYLIFNTDFLASTPHRQQRLLYGIRTLTTPEKNRNFIIRNLELAQLTERQKIGHVESRSKYDENRKTFRRNLNRILTSSSEEIVGHFRDRIFVYESDFLNNIYKKFIGFSIRYSNRKNVAYTNRYEDRRISGFNYNYHDDRNGRKRDLLEHVERKPKRHANTDSLRDYYYRDYNRYTERKVLPQKLVLDRNAYRKANLQNIRKIMTGKETTFNQFAANRFSEFNTHRNLGKQLSQNELRTITSRDKANKDKMNINYSKRVSKEISRRLLTRDVDYFNSLTENRKRHERVYNREVNEVGRGTRDIKLKLREASRFRDYVRTKRDEMSRIRKYRQNIEQFDIHRKREDVNGLRRTFSAERYTTRYISIDTKIQFDRKNDNYNVRYNRDMKNRIISEHNDNKNRRISGNRESFNFEKTNRRMSIFEFRNNNGQRNVQKNRLSLWRSFTRRFLERDNGRRSRDNFSIEHYQVRYQIRRSRRIQQNFDNASDRISRSNRLTFSLASDVIESDENRPKLIDVGFRIDNIVSRQRQSPKVSTHNKRDIKDDNISMFNNIRHSLKNRLRVREGRDRTISRIKANMISSRSNIRIARISTDYVINQRSRSNENCAANNLQVTQKLNDERRSTKPSQEDKSINMRRIYPTNEIRYFTINIFRRKQPRTYKILYGNSVFEIKWQYLFYALQFVYLISIIIQFPKNNKGKNRIFACKTPAEYLKSD
ncbi:uncharacterized protein MAL13P1.304-like [Melitaea cinxia]|uniref:uncharacterized protein MAL13P1.304-like n=1 Tax=Melitaea cinxia TaxID=113334 RepID=UPI001E271B5C|nr:uncharacterized protein MAL13P1.304-like [Melitaea cinxia]